MIAANDWGRKPVLLLSRAVTLLEDIAQTLLGHSREGGQPAAVLVRSSVHPSFQETSAILRVTNAGRDAIWVDLPKRRSDKHFEPLRDQDPVRLEPAQSQDFDLTWPSSYAAADYDEWFFVDVRWRPAQPAWGAIARRFHVVITKNEVRALAALRA